MTNHEFYINCNFFQVVSGLSCCPLQVLIQQNPLQYEAIVPATYQFLLWQLHAFPYFLLWL